MMVSDLKYQCRTTFNVMTVVASYTKIIRHFQMLWLTYGVHSSVYSSWNRSRRTLSKTSRI